MLIQKRIWLIAASRMSAVHLVVRGYQTTPPLSFKCFFRPLVIPIANSFRMAIDEGVNSSIGRTSYVIGTQSIATGT
jgi:hypothetical protein